MGEVRTRRKRGPSRRDKEKRAKKFRLGLFMVVLWLMTVGLVVIMAQQIGRTSDEAPVVSQ